MHFTALVDFHSDETASEYVAGLSYLVRPEDNKLRELVKRWMDEGLIREGGPQSALSGRASVA